MNTPAPVHSPMITPDRPTLVQGHRSFRGLSIAQNLLTPFTMYTVELDAFGLFISDSRTEVFNMAFDALFHPGSPEFAS